MTARDVADFLCDAPSRSWRWPIYAQHVRGTRHALAESRIAQEPMPGVGAVTAAPADHEQ